MEDLIKTANTLQTSILKQHKIKQKASIGPTLENKVNTLISSCQQKKETKFKIGPLLANHSLAIQIKAKLIDNSRAEFIGDFLYNVLNSKYEKHSQVTQNKKYNKPFDRVSFRFRNKHTKYMFNGIPCEASICIGKEVSMYLTIHLYQLEKIAGMYINVSNIYV